MKNILVILIITILWNILTYGQDSTKPFLFYSATFGGELNDTFASMCIDSSGNIYTVGNTDSHDYPTSFLDTVTRYTDLILNKFTSTGELIFSMKIGGDKVEFAHAILCDRNNNLWICGETNSSDFPSVKAYQRYFNAGTKDAFVMKLDSSGKILFSTYWGGKEYESFTDMTLDIYDNIWITGRTWSKDFPTTLNANKRYPINYFETFLFKIGKNNVLLYCSIFGSDKTIDTTTTCGDAIISDSKGNIYIAGYTNANKMPISSGAYQLTMDEYYDGFIAKFDNYGKLIWCTYLGGNGFDYPSNLAIDENDNIYIQTITSSSNLKVFTPGYKQKFKGDFDMYISKFNSDGISIWNTYIGGINADGIDYNSLRKIYGSIEIYKDKLYNFFRTRSELMPNQLISYQNFLNGKTDAYLLKMDTNSNILYSTFFGGNNEDIAMDFVVINENHYAICGSTLSQDFPISNHLIKKDLFNYDAFLSIFKDFEVKILYDRFCNGDSTILFASPTNDNYKYLWSTGDTTEYININKEGKYTLQVTIDSTNNSDTIYVNFYTTPYVNILSNTSFCESDTIELFSEFEISGDKFLWSTGDTTKKIIITSPGLYHLTITNKYGCIQSDTVEIFHKPKVNILGERYLCNGKYSILKTDKEFEKYIWSTGDTTKEIIISKEGVYDVIVTDKNGCVASVNFEVEMYVLKLSGYSNIDFKRVYTGEISYKSIYFKNDGDFTIAIDDVIKKNNIEEFIPILPRYIVGKSYIESIIIFKPQDINYYDETLFIKLNYPCDSTIIIPLTGAGVIKTSTSLIDTILDIGDEIKIPISIKLERGKNLPKNEYFIAEISHDKTALYPIDINIDTEIRKDKHHIFINSNDYNFTFNELVLLSNVDIIKLTWENFKWRNELIENQIIDGQIVVNMICVEDLRHIKYYNPLILEIENNQNDINTTITIIGDELGDGDIKLYNSAGIEIQNIKFNKKEKIYINEINLYTLTSGVYFITVSINNIFFIRQLVKIF